MTKKRSINLFIVFAIILVVCLVACFVNFTYPLSVDGNYYSYSNFVSNLRMGNDVGESLRILYRADSYEGQSTVNYESLREDVIKDLNNIITNEGYLDVSVVKYGNNSILVNVGNIINESERNELIDLIGNPAAISFSTSSDGKNAFAKSEIVKDVYAYSGTDQTSGVLQHSVVIEFADDFKITMYETNQENDIYIFIGDRQFGSISKGNMPENGIISFTNEMFVSYKTANTCVNQIKTSMLGLDLTQLECDVVTAGQGIGANILLSVGLTLFAVVLLVYLGLRYKEIGWIAGFAMMFFTVISLFFIQSIPMAFINFAGIIAMGLIYLLAVEAIMHILDRAKKYYQAGSPLYISFKKALKDSVARIMFTSVLALITGVVCVALPVEAIQSFAWVMIVGSIASVFVSLVLMRLFINMYLAINSTNGRKCNFHVGGKNA